MGFLDRLFGTEESATATSDERTLDRYGYLLRTAPPETIEAVHREAFSTLTDEQRAVIYEELSAGAGTGERPLSSEPATLARAASRAETRRPGTLQQSSLSGVVADLVLASPLVSAFLPLTD